MMQKTKKSSYVVNLSSMHSICELNYLRLLRVFPSYQKSNNRDFAVGEARVRLEVIERCRYTTIFRAHQTGGTGKWMSGLRMELRAYHDAGMVEISSFQTDEAVAARYTYPNAKMHQEDEKYQQNLFLSDWLESCLVNGRSHAEII